MFVGAAGAEEIDEVAADTAVLEPAMLEAVTATRSLDERSAEATVYVDPVAPAMSTQLEPPELQRRHW